MSNEKMKKRKKPYGNDIIMDKLLIGCGDHFWSSERRNHAISDLLQPNPYNVMIPLWGFMNMINQTKQNKNGMISSLVGWKMIPTPLTLPFYIHVDKEVHVRTNILLINDYMFTMIKS
jgi:hypothetical protein